MNRYLVATPPLAVRFSSSLGERLSAWGQHMQRLVRRREKVAHLRRLANVSPHLLADIGMVGEVERDKEAARVMLRAARY